MFKDKKMINYNYRFGAMNDDGKIIDCRGIIKAESPEDAEKELEDIVKKWAVSNNIKYKNLVANLFQVKHITIKINC